MQGCLVSCCNQKLDCLADELFLIDREIEMFKTDFNCMLNSTPSSKARWSSYETGMLDDCEPFFLSHIISFIFL